MKRSKLFKLFGLPVLALTLIVATPSCEVLDDLGLTNSEIAEGLREALRVSSDTSVSNASKTDGYYGNAAVKIFLPPEVQTAQSYINDYVPGGQALLEQLVLKLNRAAEDAATKATPILLDAVTNITINDAVDILYGTDTAATAYLRTNTYANLKTAFKPDIESSLTSVGAQQTWNTLTSNYNTYVANIPFLNAPPINTDLADYTTGKALDGLFHYVGNEEKKIREDPLHRVTSILERVFAKQD